MKKLSNPLESLTPKKAAEASLKVLKQHTPIVLTLLAGLMIGFALYSVNTLTSDTSQQISQAEDGTFEQPISGFNIDEDFKRSLESLSEDSDVVISSNIASYRRSAFSSATSESEWVLNAAQALEDYYDLSDIYPREDQIVTVLRDAAVDPEDSDGNIINAQNSSYRYQPSICVEAGCQAFIVSENLGSSTYQLGERDIVRRAWVNNTAEALSAYKYARADGLYPTEDNLISSLTEYYDDTFDEDFISEDPKGNEVNTDDSGYSYLGVDCLQSGCQNFVLRTTFKDGALYFQQSN